MRRFHSYGPVDQDIHFCVPRTELVENCLNSIVGEPGKSGHYFTIWAPRQTGKTWLMHQVKQKIEKAYPDRFIIGTLSMQGVFMKPDEPVDSFLSRIPLLMQQNLAVNIDSPDSWEQFKWLFWKNAEVFSKPVILFIDEFDSLPTRVIDQLVVMFRDLFLTRENSLLHGLALIGVKAVLGLDSLRGSPFNIQRSLHVPNFTLDEVSSLFDQYQEESNQTMDAELIDEVFTATNGQPGLIGWFGELLTEKFNPGHGHRIGLDVWKTVYRRALFTEWNNTVLNLIVKAKGEYRSHVINLFGKSDIPFNLRMEWCSYLYLNGIIDFTTQTDSHGDFEEVCRFSSPFIQRCLYDSLAGDLVGDRLPILALDVLDDLADVFEGDDLNLPVLLNRYKAYLVRMKARGLNPFQDQPRRADMHYTEAAGHFHLYAWLKEAIGRQCVVSPEFPTGNGKVDIHIRCREKKGIIEVKSFVDMSETARAVGQATEYARKLNLDGVTLALFVPVDDETVLAKLSGDHRIGGVLVTVVAIGWT